MRSLAILATALPLLSCVAADPLEQYKAQVQNVLSRIRTYIPSPSRHNVKDAELAKKGPKKMSILTLDNWKDVLYESVGPDTKEPEEWWVLLTGGNKTCHGQCSTIEAAFNQTAETFALEQDAPHMAMVNCEQQPVLCNSWGPSPGYLWALQMLPPPAEIDIYQRRLNFSTTNSDELIALHPLKSGESFKLVSSISHPFNSTMAKYGLSVPYGYVMWVLGQIPQWMMMLVISIVSRNFMGRRLNNNQRNQPPPRPVK